MGSTASTMQGYVRGVDFSMMSNTNVTTTAVIGIASATTVSGNWWRSGGITIAEFEFAD